MVVPHIKIPTYDILTDQWTTTSFNSQEEFAIYMDSIWNDECEYNFTDEAHAAFREKAIHFEKNKCYTFHPIGSKERKDFWRTEGVKCVKGVIYIQGNRQWYLPRDYYFFLNYCQFANKEKQDLDTFPDLRDIQYHLSLYEKRAEAHHLHAILVKKRQMASSLFHCAKILNKFWFDRNAINKIFASDEKYINMEDGIWKFLVKYREFLNDNTDWTRECQPDQEFSWMQRKEIKIGGRKTYKGRMSVISGISLKIKATNGVGGACAYGFHEEAGIAPKLHDTYGFFRPATEAGIYTTGMFIAAGSVGDLKQCEPLRKYIFSPKGNRFLHVRNTWVDKHRVPTETGLYIPEHWGMQGFIDKNGNSDKQAAFIYLKKFQEDLKSNPDVSPQDYQLEISQHPIYLRDAFANRNISEFPVILCQNQQERIELKTKENKWLFKPQKGLLKEVDNKVILDTTKGGPEHEYPIKPTWPDKRGVVTIYEPPDENPEFLTYFAGVDTIEADETTTSESVFSIDIFKTVIEVRYRDTDGKIKTRIEGDKLVATYRGRFSSKDGGVESVNEQGWLLIKMYNAFAFVERNKPNFINYMQRHGRAETYLAKESDVPMFKDLNLNSPGKSKFGFSISSTNKDDNMWKLLKSYIKEYLLAEYDKIYKGDTDEVLKVIRGIDKIDDYWLLEEFIQFSPDSGNYDRIVSFGAAVMIAKIYQQNRFIKKRNEVKNETPQNTVKKSKQINLLGGGPRKSYGNSNKRQKPRSLL